MLLLLFHGDQPQNQIRQAQQDQYLGPSLARLLLRPPALKTPPFAQIISRGPAPSLCIKRAKIFREGVIDPQAVDGKEEQ